MDEDIVYAYRYRPELRRRAQLMIDCFERKLDTVFDVRRLEPPGVVNGSRACGACRFADDTFTSVLDRDNRAHDTGQYVCPRRVVLPVKRKELATIVRLGLMPPAPRSRGFAGSAKAPYRSRGGFSVPADCALTLARVADG